MKKMISLRTLLKTIQLQKLKKFKSKIDFSIEKKNFIIRTATGYDDLLSVLQLRHQVFYEELLHRENYWSIDYDRFDLLCDHLCIIHKETGKMIGTYRMNCSRFNRQFYSSTEFKINQLIKLPGHKLELGRACVHRDFRNGVAITLLWTGIMEYLKKSGAEYLFGCSSVKTTDFDEINVIYHHLKENNHIRESLKVKPKGRFKVNKKYLNVNLYDRDNQSHPALKKIPSLLLSYLKAGAYVCGEPALDKDFQCFDFLTVLPVEQLNIQIEKRINSCSSN